MPKNKKNTYRSGILHFFFFPVGKKFMGVCGELCIVKEEKDLELVGLKTFAAAKEYLQMVIKNKLGEHLLNQDPPEEIVELFVEHVRKQKMQQILEKQIKIQELLRKSGKQLINA
ncbi:MAG TPA: hypothetical protein ENI70_00990 [Candidatus Peregrinibacteria bacterium]|nr:hypothetical protein [Candidatus Peregrinibacteria bacterium]